MLSKIFIGLTEKMGNKFVYEERVEEVAERMIRAEPKGFKGQDQYFRNVL